MKKLIHNILTDEKNLVDLSPEEIAENEKTAIKEDALSASLMAKNETLEIKRAALRDKLGLTAEEAELLF